MHRKEAASDRRAQIDRIAWLVTFVVPLVLAVLLLTVKSAQAADPIFPPTSLDVEEVFEAEIEEVSELEPEEACIEAEEAFEMDELAELEVEEICEEEEDESDRREGAASAKDGSASTCALRSTHAHATTKDDRLKLTIGYTTTDPTNAKIEIKQGATKLASLSRHLGRSGVLRHTERLDEDQDGKLTVRIKLPAGGAGCPSRRLVLFPR